MLHNSTLQLRHPLLQHHMKEDMIMAPRPRRYYFRRPQTIVEHHLMFAPEIYLENVSDMCISNHPGGGRDEINNFN